MISSLLVPLASRDGGIGAGVRVGAGATHRGWGYPYGSYGGYNYGGYGSGYGYGDSSGSRVAELQTRLARAGYYHSRRVFLDLGHNLGGE